MSDILVIDDDESIRSLLSFGLTRLGHRAETARTIEEGLSLMDEHAFDVVLLDILMPDGNGLEALPRIRRKPDAPEVVIITGAGVSGAELAIRGGAWDYVQKPFTLKEVTLPVVRALEYRQEKTKASRPPLVLERSRIIGSDPAFMECLNLMAMAATTDSTVLIGGETGTGKELFARAIHDNSSRKKNAFVVVDCAALPPTLVESVLFGHQKGSFTGADASREGLVKTADGGTLFLDEVGELPLETQKSFLRLLQEKSFRPIGSKGEIRSDFRLVAATNRNLESMVAEGAFRQDLLYRLRSLTIVLPPLRHRRTDIRELTMHLVARLCERFNIGPKGVSPEFFDYLAAYDWPGNVRELVNVLEGAITMARYDPTLFPQHLTQHIRVHYARVSDARSRGAEESAQAIASAEAETETSRAQHEADVTGATEPATEELASIQDLPTLKEYRKQAADKAERRYMEELAKRSGGDVADACAVSGLSRSRLYDLLKTHGVRL